MSAVRKPDDEITPQQALVGLIKRSVNDPAFFITKILRPEELGPRWVWQKRVCDQIRDELASGNRHVKVLIRSCHGAGKTFLAAALTLWWTQTRKNARTLTLAPTWSGVEDHIWPNIAQLRGGSLLRGWGKMLQTELVLGEESADGGKPVWYATGASSDHPENLEGHHSPTAAMRVVDEAKAVEAAIFTATEGMLDAPRTLDLWISTPSIATGEFYKRDTGSEDCIRHVIDVDQLIADGVTEKIAWKENLLEKWGESSPEYQSRVMARYIDNADGALFPSSWIEKAMAHTWTVEKPVNAALDVAGSTDGDQNAFVVVSGPDSYDHVQVKNLSSWHERDTMVTKGRAVKAFRESGARSLRVDVIGLGKGVADAARQDQVPVAEYRASDRASEPERFLNRKAEDAWRLRALLEKGLVRLPADQALKAELVAMRYEVMSSGKLRVVDPSDSPDLADAVIIGCAGAVRSFGFVAMSDDRADRFTTVSDLRGF